jgi:uncharacterized protein YutD
MAIDPTIWGPNYWFFLHTVAFCYPLFPSTVTKKKYYNLVHNLPLFIPTEKIGNEFSNLLDKYPVTPYLDNRESFLKWTHFIHNKINKKLNKPIISFTKFIKEYKNYKIKRNKTEYKHMIKQIISIILIFILACLIYYSIIIYEKRR